MALPIEEIAAQLDTLRIAPEDTDHLYAREIEQIDNADADIYRNAATAVHLCSYYWEQREIINRLFAMHEIQMVQIGALEINRNRLQDTIERALAALAHEDYDRAMRVLRETTP